MGGRDFCSVIGCSSGRMKSNNAGQQLSFFRFPSGKSKPALRRRAMWVKAIRRSKFVPTQNTKVCGLHFVSGIAVNDEKSVDFVPTLRLGYENEPGSRKTAHSQRAIYFTDTDVAGLLDNEAKRQVSGLVQGVGAEVTVDTEGSFCEHPTILLPKVEARTNVPVKDHGYNRHPSLEPGCGYIVSPPPALTATQQSSVACQARAEPADKIIRDLRQQLVNQQREMDQLNDAVKSLRFTPEQLLNSDEAVQFYTGFTDKNTYDAVFQFILPKARKMRYWDGQGNDSKEKSSAGRPTSIPLEVQFFAVLARLKVGLFVADLAARLQISPAQFSQIFTTWIRLLRLELQTICCFPTRCKVRNFLSEDAARYCNLRCLLGCTEFLVETPLSLTAQRQTWSAYKSHNTCKVLVACTPDGVLCYISKLYGGASSDKFIATDCGFLDHLQPGDHIMAEEGFDIRAEVEDREASVNLPPCLKPGQDQFDEGEAEETRRFAEVRVHVERVIGRIKSYHLLDGNLPLTLHPLAEDIIHTCAYLTLFQCPVIAKVNFPSGICGNTVVGGSKEPLVNMNA